jgi:hypothetical protein
VKRLAAELIKTAMAALVIGLTVFSAKWVFGPPVRQHLTITIETPAEADEGQRCDLPQPPPLLEI